MDVWAPPPRCSGGVRPETEAELFLAMVLVPCTEVWLHFMLQMWVQRILWMRTHYKLVPLTLIFRHVYSDKQMHQSCSCIYMQDTVGGANQNVLPWANTETIILLPWIWAQDRFLDAAGCRPCCCILNVDKRTLDTRGGTRSLDMGRQTDGVHAVAAIRTAVVCYFFICLRKQAGGW